MTKRREFYIKSEPKRSEPYHLKGVRLPNVYLLNGFEIENDPEYGELVTIHEINGLHRAIGLSIIGDPSPLSGGEFRFLRKQLLLTQPELAHAMGVDEQTIANYEKGKTHKLGPADALIRYMYVVHILPEETRLKLFRQIAEELEKRDTQTQLPEVPRRKIAHGWELREHAHA